MSASDCISDSYAEQSGGVMTDGPLPQDEVAHLFMRHKGYGDIEPYDIESVEDLPCWYYSYDLPEGVLELEVFWNAKRQEWETTVTTFTLADE